MRVLKLFCFVLLAGCSSAHADLSVPTGAQVLLGGGRIDLGGTDVSVGGMMFLGTGALDRVGSMALSGALDAGSGTVELSGDWTNAGAFTPGTSSVRFFDGGRAQSLFMGDSAFHDLQLLSGSGKTYSIESARTLAIASALTIRGVAGQPIQVASPDPAQVAFLDLAPAGSQDIGFTGVSNVHAIGQPLAPDEINQGGSGNDTGWFGTGVLNAVPVPAMTTLSALVLVLLTLALAFVNRPRAGHQAAWHSRKY